MSGRARDQDAEQATHRHYRVPEGGGTQVTAPAHNANYGTNYGIFHQHNTNINAPIYLDGMDLATRLNPILDASHTRNLVYSPPNSECLEGTRLDFIAEVFSWARTGVYGSNFSHILWIYGYAGCGKSAISLAVARQLAEDGLLAASFFFFRGAGDRSKAVRLIPTIVCQMVAAAPATSDFVEEAIKRNPWLLSTSTSNLGAQFMELVFKPIVAIAPLLKSGPLTILLDGVDECEDHDEMGHFIVDVIACFNKHPLAPLRFVIASRVEDHLHQRLYSSNQVRLLDLVDHTSNEDIEVALESRLGSERGGGVLKYDESWPSEDDKRRLVKHIGKSFIFMNTIFNELFKPFTDDRKTPMDRLPLLFGMAPDFDALYMSLLMPLERAPHFLEIIGTVALAEEALSISQIADLLGIRVVDVASVLLNLHAIMQIPGDDRSPVTLWHSSFRDFLCSEDRAGPFFASPTYHWPIASRSIRIVTSSHSTPPPASDYAKRFAMGHLMNYLRAVHENVASYDALLGELLPDLVGALFQADQTALEAACLRPDWKLVRALVGAGADVNVRFTNLSLRSPKRFGVALHAACYHNATDMIHLLVDKGADLNVIVSFEKYLMGGSGLCYCPFPLAWASLHGDVGLVRKLLGCGADPDLRGGLNIESALHHASSGRGDASSKIVRVLLERGVNPNLPDGAGMTPLHRACRDGAPENTRLLLEHGADPNVKTAKGGETPLHKACRTPNLGALAHVQLLLSHGACPNNKTGLGDTPLHYAYYYEKPAVAEYLLSHNADPSVKNVRGLTPKWEHWRKNQYQIAQNLKGPN